ncbi:hypothetical protein SAMN02745146_3073 [Hymenobacter daecheongensis DSM 21074]|uniref:Uncharacterized protein n=1 Tax=Hymenobacter daecheongensis DSM 21074 TaxID=1121955 RepID=A0A1M6J2X2_9BACT|nr:hypothetical protein SAMN02745146_3073 [Hymenobacter daecheongensis DSM 21074]
MVGLATIPAAPDAPPTARQAVANSQGHRLPLVGTSHARPRQPPHTTLTLRQPAACRATSPTGQAARHAPLASRPGPGRRSASSLPCSAEFWAPYLRPKPRYAASAPLLHVAPALSPPHRHNSNHRLYSCSPDASPPHRCQAAQGQKKAPRRLSAPPDFVAGRRLKSPPPAGKACVQATQAEARPASRRVLLGSAPSPRHHAQADARSSASGSAA